MDTRSITRIEERSEDDELERRRLATAQRMLRAHPREIGRYRVVGKIGEGGMGVVFRAHDPELDRPVAIKLLSKHMLELSGIEQQMRMLREARALAAVSHPNVIDIYEVGEHRGAPFLAMEYVDGASLSEVIECDAPPWETVVRLFVDAGRGLAAAHECGLVHRDFKPSNVLVDRDGRVRVLDFGVAKGLCEPSSHPSGGVSDPGSTSGSGLRDATPLDRTPGSHLIELTEAGVLIGTPAYMAPEQLRGSQADALSDQFAFCVSLWEGLFRKRPFTARTPKELLAAILRGPPATPRGHHVPKAIVRVLRRGLQPDPTARWAGLPDLLDALERQLRGRRRWLWAAGGVLATVVVLSAWPSAEAASCARPDEALPAWTHADRSVRPKDVDAEAWARIEDALDTYAEQLEAGWSRLCATPDATKDGARACLQQRTAAAETIVGLVGDAGGSDVARMIASLRDVETCFTPVVEAPRPGPAIADDVRRLETMLTRAGVMQMADRRDEALELYDEVLVGADAIDWPPLVARALVQRASLLLTLGRQDDTRAALERAYEVASAAGDHQAAMVAAQRLAQVIGVEMNRADEALQWARHSEAAARRAGMADPLAHLHGTLGLVHMYAGNVDEAVLHLERATLVLQTKPDMTTRERQNAHRELGGLLLNLGRAEQARAHFEEGLAIAEASYGPRSHDVAALSFNLGLATQVATGDHEAALALYTRAADVYRDHFEGDHPDIADAMFHAGKTLAVLGRHDEAEPRMREGLAMLARTLGEDDLFVAQARIELAELLYDTGRHGQAREVLGTATTGAEAQVGREHPLVARGYRLLGVLAFADGDHALARQHLETSLTALPGEDRVSIETRLPSLERLVDLAVATGDREAAKRWAADALRDAEQLPEGPEREELVARMQPIAG